MKYWFIAVPLLLAAPAFAEEKAEEQPAFTYTGETGPEHWATIDAANSLCGQGKLQSPVSLSKAAKTALPELEADYKDVELTVDRRANHLSLIYPEGSVLKVGDKTYQLERVVFHTPAEHTISGRKFDLEVQLEHKAADGARANISVMMKRGFSNAAFNTLLGNLPRQNTAEPLIVEGVFFTPQVLLPANMDYYTYEGSDTTPPCTEGVRWYVLKSYVELGGEQLKAIQKIVGANARPVQPLQGRQLQQK